MRNGVTTEATAAAAAVSILTSLLLAVLSYLEHHRSPRPSTLITCYLVLTVFFDIIRTRTFFRVENARTVGAAFTVFSLLKFTVALLELKEKREWLLDPDDFSAPESTANFFNRFTFFWVNPLLLKGFSGNLQPADLLECERQMVGREELFALTQLWRSSESSTPVYLQSLIEPAAQKESPHALFKLVLRHYWKGFASAVVPRFCYTGFRFSQPFLLQRTLMYMRSDGSRAPVGYGLIAAYILVCVGFAVSTRLITVAWINATTLDHKCCTSTSHVQNNLQAPRRSHMYDLQ